eukprot:COSAG02_NODE_1805_length_10872_cov_7.969461_2_plen_111_part_00
MRVATMVATNSNAPTQEKNDRRHTGRIPSITTVLRVPSETTWRVIELLRVHISANVGYARSSYEDEGNASNMHGYTPPRYKSIPAKCGSTCSMIHFAIVLFLVPTLRVCL